MKAQALNLQPVDMDLTTILRKHLLWLQGDARGEQADFSDSDLSGTDLSRYNLRKANFTRANLQDVDFSGTDLRDAILLGADMRGTKLFGTKLTGADIRVRICFTPTMRVLAYAALI